MSDKFYQLVHPGGPGGLGHDGLEEMRMREQDEQALPATLYAVCFFPRITNLGKAQLNFYPLHNTLAQSPEAAITKYMDSMAPGQTWESYYDAGHRVRKICVTDLGDAETGNLKEFKTPTFSNTGETDVRH